MACDSIGRTREHLACFQQFGIEKTAVYVCLVDRKMNVLMATLMNQVLPINNPITTWK